MSMIHILACSAVGCLLLAASAAVADKDDGFNWHYSGPSLQGAWEVETAVRVNAEDCTTAAR